MNNLSHHQNVEGYVMKKHPYMPISLKILAHRGAPNQWLTTGSNTARWIMQNADRMNLNLEAGLPGASLAKCNVATWENLGFSLCGVACSLSIHLYREMDFSPFSKFSPSERPCICHKWKQLVKTPRKLCRTKNDREFNACLSYICN